MEEFSRRHRAKWLAYAPFRRGLPPDGAASGDDNHHGRRAARPIQRHLGLPADRLTLIPNGVELAALDALETNQRCAARSRRAMASPSRR